VEKSLHVGMCNISDQFCAEKRLDVTDDPPPINDESTPFLGSPAVRNAACISIIEIPIAQFCDGSRRKLRLHLVSAPLAARVFTFCDAAQYLPSLLAGFLKRQPPILPERVPRFPTIDRARILNEEGRYAGRLDANAEPPGISVPQPHFAPGGAAGVVDMPLG
jgi:hypothetical protein